MYGYLNTIKIGNNDIINPNEFTPAREDVYAAEYTTCTGATIADCIGWKYSDMQMSWDTLPQSQLEDLLDLGSSFTLKFTDPDGTTAEETVRPTKRIMVGTRFTDGNGDVVWKDIQLEVSFINVHNY